jgi:hypothetical protein
MGALQPLKKHYDFLQILNKKQCNVPMKSLTIPVPVHNGFLPTVKIIGCYFQARSEYLKPQKIREEYDDTFTTGS